MGFEDADMAERLRRLVAQRLQRTRPSNFSKIASNSLATHGQE